MDEKNVLKLSSKFSSLEINSESFIASCKIVKGKIASIIDLIIPLSPTTAENTKITNTKNALR
ncbi:hypothetical protein D3C78_1536470 [compost metagenome]